MLCRRTCNGMKMVLTKTAVIIPTLHLTPLARRTVSVWLYVARVWHPPRVWLLGLPTATTGQRFGFPLAPLVDAVLPGWHIVDVPSLCLVALELEASCI